MTLAKSKRERRGGVYIVVLGAAMIVAMIALTSMHLSRIQMKNALASEKSAEARLLAHSAVEFALARIDLDSDWRSHYLHAQWGMASSLQIGQGSITFRILDLVDGDLADNDYDPYFVQGIGRVDGASWTYVVQVRGDGEILPGGWTRAPSPQ